MRRPARCPLNGNDGSPCRATICSRSAAYQCSVPRTSNSPHRSRRAKAVRNRSRLPASTSAPSSEPGPRRLIRPRSWPGLNRRPRRRHAPHPRDEHDRDGRSSRCPSDRDRTSSGPPSESSPDRTPLRPATGAPPISGCIAQSQARKKVGGCSTVPSANSRRSRSCTPATAPWKLQDCA